MKPFIVIALTLLALWSGAAESVQGERVLVEGATLDVNGRRVTLTHLDALPNVESEYTKRFKFESCDNPKLKELRDRYKLGDVIATGKDEFEKQVLLMDWTHRQFRKFGAPSTNATSAIAILNAIDQGHTFFCSHYAHVFVSSAASLGWVDRELALRRHQGVAKVGGSTEHSSTEIWSNQHRKWVMLDPTSNMFLEKDGVPLNAWEIRQEWFYHDGTNVIFVIGKERKRYRKADLPIFLRRLAGFGDLAVNTDELDKYGFIGYIPNTDFLDSREDYAGMFIVKDRLCDGTRWHVRTAPANPAVDPYFPIGQAALSLVVVNEGIAARLKTLTPNFERYEVQWDDHPWKSCGDSFAWDVHPGINRLAVKTVNRFGVSGPVSTAVLKVSSIP